MDEMEQRVTTLEAHMDGHEELCAQRLSTIMGRLDRIEMILISCFGAIMLGLAGMLAHSHGWL